MTEIEKKKALALVNEARSLCRTSILSDKMARDLANELERAIEQHEAFRQHVSDAVEEYADRDTHAPITYLGRFIIAKPDPMDLVADDMMLGAYNPRREWGAELRAAIEKRGGKIIFNEE